MGLKDKKTPRIFKSKEDFEKIEYFSKEMNNRIHKSLDFEECKVCHCLLPRSKLKLHVKPLKNNVVIANLIKKDDLKYPFFACVKCFKSIEEETAPVFSVLNNCKLIEPPDCIKELNMYERIIIQPARCFLTIIKLKPCGKVPLRGNLVPGLQGIIIK